jgi:integrase
MKLAESGVRGVFWRATARGTQELRTSGGRVRGDWWIRWACPHGHLHREQIGPKSLAREEAERRRLERPCPLRKPKPASYLLADVIREYLDATKNQKRSHKDDARYGAMWTGRFAGRTLDEITAGDVEKIRAERLKAATRATATEEKADRRKTVTPATVNREVAFLRHVFNVAIRDEKTERNPVTKLRFFKERGRVRYLMDEEEPKLLKALPSDEDRQRVTALLHTGLRKAEFLGLRWKHVDFKAGVLTIPRSKNGETRHVPMNATVREILGRRPRSLNRDALVFPNGAGMVDLRWAEKTFPEATSAAQIEDFRLHDLRHTFASRLVMAGVDLLTVMQLGGWKSLAMVQRYGHLSPGHRQSAVERLVNRPVPAETAAASGAE